MNIYSITNLLISISTVYADNPRSLNIEDNTLKLNTPSNVKEISHNYAELSKDNSAESSNERFMYPTSGPTSDNSRHRRLPKPKPEPQLKLGEVNPQSSSDITNSLTDTDGDVLNNVVTEEETGRFFENMIIASGGIIMSISGYLAWLKTTCCTNTCSSNLFPESINRFFHNGYTTILNSEDNPLGAEEAVTNHGDIEIVVIDNIMHDRTDDGYIPDTSTTSGYQGV